MELRAWQGDITTLAVDAIVNAANSTLLGGGGVDGAIHDAAGPQLLAECRTLGGCDTRPAKNTPRHHLPAKHVIPTLGPLSQSGRAGRDTHPAHPVIHTVGPVWQGGRADEDTLLANCYRNPLALAIQHNLRSIAFPAISTGAYSFPLKRATHIAVTTVADVLRDHPQIDHVI